MSDHEKEGPSPRYAPFPPTVSPSCMLTLPKLAKWALVRSSSVDASPSPMVLPCRCARARAPTISVYARNGGVGGEEEKVG